MNDAFADAERLRAGGDIAAAVEAYRHLLNEPSGVSSAKRIGDALAQLGQHDGARDAFAAAIAAAPEDCEAQFKLGNAHIRLEDFEQAVDCFQKATELAPNNAAAFFNLGNAEFRLQNFEKALQAYTRASELDDQDPATFNNVGTAAAELKNLDLALSAFHQAVLLDHEFASGFSNLAQTFICGGMLETAEWPARRFIELRPGESRGYLMLTIILSGLERNDDVLVVLKDWLEREPEQPFATHMYQALSGESEMTRASDEYVRQCFDGYAPSFDSHITTLDYRAPELVAEVVAEFADDEASMDILDIGCGTGLAGPLLKRFAQRLDGVDLSSMMLERCRSRDVYDELIEAELTSFLEQCERDYDLIVAVDAVVYIGDLREVCMAAARRLRNEGWLVLTTEHLEDDQAEGAEYRLNPTGRFSHTEPHLREATAAAGMTIVSLKTIVPRKEAGAPVNGHLLVARMKR